MLMYAGSNVGVGVQCVPEFFLINAVKRFGVINEANSNVALKLVGFLDDLLQCLNHFDGVPTGLVSSLFFWKGADKCCFDRVVYDLHD